MFTFVDTFAKWMTFTVLGAIPSVDQEKLAQAKAVLNNDAPEYIASGTTEIVNKVSAWSKYIKWIVIILLSITGFIFFKTLYNKLNR